MTLFTDKFKLIINTLKRHPIISCTLMLVCASLLFLTVNMVGNWQFVLELRSKKLLSLLVVGFAIGTSTLLFQTLTHNPILTPALLGFDSLYVLIKSVMVFSLGSVGMAMIPTVAKFTMEVLVMLMLSLLLFRLLFGKHGQDLTRLILVGVVFGLLFRSLSYLVARMIDPEEFVAVQAASYAQFNTVNGQVLGFALVLCVIAAVVMYRLRHQCDVLHDINQAAQFADTAVMMKAGRIIEVGAPVDVLTAETMKRLYQVDITVLQHHGRPVIVDTLYLPQK